MYMCTRAEEEPQEVAGSKSGGGGQSETPRKLSASGNGGMPCTMLLSLVFLRHSLDLI